ncbi:hypothetical protein FHP05_06245 [Cerasibacillus terrae]|uniref:Uncharacterized protein n=1 Tax=Cerasibacillus terrae TaxID=2498845 RepID=A0A5C8NX92_9BACI|nr:hypothetical protein [Cerasibacillus terrae]TXL65719.1 hypothetical protein FHP05_06245 [Cerasibacillus terrae]
MNNNHHKRIKIIGSFLFLLAIGFFCLQIAYLFVHTRLQVEYVDDRIFYIVNIICVICLATSLLFLFSLTRKWKWVGASIVAVFIIANGVLLADSHSKIKNITSISPDFKHVLTIKENIKTNEAVYYRNYYGILALPKETLPYQTDGRFKVEWLANDIAAVTYLTENGIIHQYIGTYGDRGGGLSYYYVGAEIQGVWKGNNVEMISNTDGISVTQNGQTETFDWDHIVQFGTLAIVLTENNQAKWTISLNENFTVDSSSATPPSGEINLYRATMEDNKPILLNYKGAH